MYNPGHGIYNGNDASGYYEWPYLSQSQLKALSDTPAHFQHVLANPIRPTPAMRLGSAVDCIVTRGPNVFCDTYICAPQCDKRSKEYKAFAAKNTDKIILTHDECCRVGYIAEHVLAHPIAAEWVANSDMQVAVVFDLFGVRCKALIDGVRRDTGMVWDLKTTSDPTHGGFARSMVKYGYHVQAAWYLHAMSTIDDIGRDYGLIAACTMPPYQVETYILTYSAILAGEQKIKQLMRKYKQLCEVDQWPSTTGELHQLDLPVWYYQQMEDDR